MVSIEEIERDRLTSDDVLSRELVMRDDAQTEAEWMPWWDDEPENQPGDEAWMGEDGEGRPILMFTTDDGFRAELVCLEYGDWRARIDVPEEVGSYIVQEHTFKARHPVMIGDIPVGYVDEVLWRGEGEYDAEAVILRIAEAEGMPVTEVDRFIRDLREEHAETLEAMDEMGAKLDAAHKNAAEDDTEAGN